MRQPWRSEKGVFWATLSAPLVWIVLFFVVPLSIIWAYSFGRTLGLTEVAITGTLANYARVAEPVYLLIFAKSLWFAALTTLLCLIIGFPYALAMTFASARGKVWLMLGIMLPFWTNLLVRTYALMAVLRNEGYINDVLQAIGVGRVEMLHTNFAVVVGLVYVHLPFIVLPLYSALDRMDRSLIEASLDLGAGHITTLLRVVVPLAAGDLVGGAAGLHPGAGLLSHPRSAGRARQPDDRQRDRAPVQARQ
jgi:spermidine/putrescine transport system permease protein